MAELQDLINLIPSIRDGSYIDVQDEYGNFIIHNIAKHQEVLSNNINTKTLINDLLSQSYDVNKLNSNNDNALMVYVKSNQNRQSNFDSKFVQTLFTYGLEYTQINNDGLDILHLLIKTNTLSSEFYTIVLARNSNHQFILDDENKSVVYRAIENGNISALHSLSRYTSLFTYDNLLFSLNRNYDTFQTIIRHLNVIPQTADEDGNTLLHHTLSKSTQYDTSFIFQKIMNKEAKNNEGQTAFLYAIKNNNYQGLSEILRSDSILVDINTKDNYGKCAVMYSIDHDRTGYAKSLVKHKSWKCIPGAGGDTILIYLIKTTLLNTVEDLLTVNEIRKTINCRNDEEDTALSIAVKQNKILFVKLLLKIPQIDTTLLYNGKTVLEIANDLEHTQISTLLS